MTRRNFVTEAHAETLEKIRTAFQDYRKKYPKIKAHRYPADLRAMAAEAVSAGLKHKKITSAASVCLDTLLRWSRDSEKESKVKPVKKLDVIPVLTNSADSSGNYLLRLEGNGFRIELMTR